MKLTWVDPNVNIESIGTAFLHLNFEPGKDIKHNFNILNNININIIGMDIMRKNNIILDTKKTTAIFQRDEINENHYQEVSTRNRSIDGGLNNDRETILF